ncbi:MAG: hypothetical protein ABSA02_29780 [Trebonia sp.]|jgi:hypothetical protein
MRKFIAPAVSGAAIAVVAVAGCAGGTTTVREMPAAAPATHTSAPAKPTPVVTKTVTAKPAPGVAKTVAPGAAAAPAPVVVPSPYYVPAPVTFSDCGGDAASGGINVNSVTSCPFAENVESAWNSSGDSGSGTVTAYSPVTDQTYTMYCTPSDTGYEVCTGGHNSYVEFAASTPTVPQQASGQFDNVNTLTDSVANEQQAALAAAPSSDYDSSDNATVTVTLTSLGDNTYSANATDSDGDVGGGDTITVSPDGTSWSDNGMGWSGPDIGIDYWITPTVSDITS